MDEDCMNLSPDEIKVSSKYLQIIQLTANSHHKLFRVACTDADVLTTRMSPFTVKQNLMSHSLSVSLASHNRTLFN